MNPAKVTELKEDLHRFSGSEKKKVSKKFE